MIQLAVLDSLSSLPFHALTHASLQPMLYRAGNGQITAVGATEDGEAAALALAVPDRRSNGARVASLFVRRESRRRGIATRLLAALEDELRRRQVDALSVSYQTGRPTSAAVPRLLGKRGWPEAKPERLICRCDRRMLDSPWLRDYRLADDTEIVAWSDVRGDELEALRASQSSDPWIPEALDPWRFADVAFNSVALRCKGTIAGWVLTQRFDSSTLVYANSYMHPALQHRARIIPLYVSAVRQQAAEPALPNAIWVVPFVHGRMVRFVRQWMAPYMTRIEEQRASVKRLAATERAQPPDVASAEPSARPDQGAPSRFAAVPAIP